MKASELIGHLQSSMEKHGDVDVAIMDGEHEVEVRGIVWCSDEKDKVQSFLIADDNTFDAFCDTSGDEEE